MIRYAFALILLAGTALAQAPAATPESVRGTIIRLDGPTLTVRDRDEQIVQIILAEPIVVDAIVPAALTDAKPGRFIRAVARGPRDKMRAIEVLISPATAPGTNEGHFPWDLQPESTMTNATIESEVSGSDGRTLTVVAKGERLTMVVPPDAPVVTVEPGMTAMLTPGAKVFLRATKGTDGVLHAGRVNVGKDGLTPPM